MRGLVAAPEDARAAEPGLYLLHTGNLGKLPDSSVPPSMRALALSLQDQFVPRSEQPCLSSAEDSKLPPHLLRTLAALQPWRARLKALGDCRMPAPRPAPLWWIPAAELRPAPSATGGSGRPHARVAHGAWPRRLLDMTFGVRVRWACEAGAGAEAGGGKEEGDEGEGEGDGEAECGETAAAREAVGAPVFGVAAAAPVMGGQLCALLDSLPPGGAGQLFTLLQEPSILLWSSFLANGGGGARMLRGEGDEGGGGGGDGGDGGEALAAFETWLEAQPDNPLVRALNGCGAAALAPPRRATPGEAGAVAGAEGDTSWRPVLTQSHLESAKLLLEERILLGTVSSPNRTARSLQLFSAFFGWPQRWPPAPPPARDSDGDAGDGDGGGTLLEAAAAEIPPPMRAAVRRKVWLDERLYEFADRLSSEQLRSVVWGEENTSDVCAAADAASLGLARRGLPLPLQLDEQVSSCTL